MVSLKKRYIIYSIIIGSLTFLDILTKQIIVKHLGPGNNFIPVIKNFFHIVYVENRGVTFGMLRNIPEALRMPILVIIPVIIIFFLFYILYKLKGKEFISEIALCCILAGAFGNIHDRIRYDYVVDFIYFNLGFMWWPAFNVADAVIVIGTCLLSIEIIRGKKIF
ncbi:MAG: signal peptidase II [Pseudomonadota bacterium]